LPYGIGRNSWAGGSESAAPGRNGYAWGQTLPGLQIGVGRKPTAIIQHTMRRYIFVFSSLCRPYTCVRVVGRSACVSPSIIPPLCGLAVELSTTRVSLCGLTLDPIPMVSHCLLHYLPPTAGNVLFVSSVGFPGVLCIYNPNIQHALHANPFCLGRW
jgi:hypothetical protein